MSYLRYLSYLPSPYTTKRIFLTFSTWFNKFLNNASIFANHRPFSFSSPRELSTKMFLFSPKDPRLSIARALWTLLTYYNSSLMNSISKSTFFSIGIHPHEVSGLQQRLLDFHIQNTSTLIRSYLANKSERYFRVLTLKCSTYPYAQLVVELLRTPISVASAILSIVISMPADKTCAPLFQFFRFVHHCVASSP